MKTKVGSRTDKVFDLCILAIGILVLLIILYPLYFIVIASFSNPTQVANGQVWLFPKDVTLMGYIRVLEEQRVWTGYRNTIFYTVAGTLFSLALTLPAGYALSRKDLKGRNLIMLYFVFTMYFGGGLIPTYLNIKSFHLLDSPLVLILPFALSVYNLIITRTFFASTIPNELLEAAQMDGCRNTRFFFQIVLPLSKAIIAVIGLYYAVGQWNQYFNAMIYITDKEYEPLQIVLRDLLIKNKAFEEGDTGSGDLQKIADAMKYSIIIISTLPIMCVYPFIQKYFAKGVMIGAIKG